MREDITPACAPCNAQTARLRALGAERNGHSREPGGGHEGNSCHRRHREHAEGEHRGPDAGRAPAAEGLGVRQRERDRGESDCLENERRMGPDGPRERAGDVERIGGAGDAEAERRAGAREGQRGSAHAGDDGGSEHGNAGLRRPSGPSAKSSPPRGSRQQSTTQTAASAA